MGFKKSLKVIHKTPKNIKVEIVLVPGHFYFINNL